MPRDLIYSPPDGTCGTKRKVGYMMQGSLAEKLRVLRARVGLSLTEAASRAGVTRDTLSDLEHGKRQPYMPTLSKIAAGYDVPVEDLLEEPLVPLAEAPQGTGPEERQRPSLAQVQEVFASPADGLNHYCARWEQKLPTLQGTPEEVEDFFLTLQDFHAIIMRVFEIEFRAIDEALALASRYGSKSGLPRDMAVGFIRAEAEEHSLMHEALNRYRALAHALAESIKDEEAAERTRRVLAEVGV